MIARTVYDWSNYTQFSAIAALIGTMVLILYLLFYPIAIVEEVNPFLTFKKVKFGFLFILLATGITLGTAGVMALSGATISGTLQSVMNEYHICLLYTSCIAIKQCFQERYAVDAPFLYTVYSRDELMLSEYCPINSVICKRTSRNCGLCRQGAEYALIDVKKHRYPILCDDACRTHILHYEVRNHIAQIPEAKRQGIRHFLCTFTIERAADCHRIISACKAQLQMKQDA